jgi:MFS family permease
MGNEINKAIHKKNAYLFIMLFGVVSLLGDFVYEGGRSVAGPYLLLLGASSIVVGFVSGAGEFLGYMLRIASGWSADKTNQYWTFAFLGYGLIICIPLLAFAGYWQIAAILYISERIGKAIRSPSRDVLLSNATKQVGRGWGFGIHEALDQIGAIVGPLTFTAIFLLNGGYKTGFSILLVPAILCIVILCFARWKYPHPEKMEMSEKAFTQDKAPKDLTPLFWYYCLFTLLVVIGFSSFPLMSFHWSSQKVVSDIAIPIFYAVAMGVDAVVALLIGKAYDKYGLISLAVLPILTLPIPFFAFTNSWMLAFLSVVFWGAAMGVHETIMRAAIADMTHIKKRGTGYGIFNTIYGTGLFVGAFVTGILYSWNLFYIMVFVTIMVIASLPILVFIRRQCILDAKEKKS